MIQIDWRLRPVHNAICSISIEGETIELDTSYVADSFAGLLSAALDIKRGSNATYATLAGEPAGSIIFFRQYIDDQLLLTIMEYARHIRVMAAHVQRVQALARFGLEP